MKNLMSLSKLFLALAVIFFASSCDPDDPIDSIINPNSGLESGTGLISESTTINPGETINVRLVATAGDNEMNSISIRENGDLVEVDRIDIDGVDATSNAIALFDGERSSFAFDFAITPHAAGTSTYEFVVAGDLISDSNTTAIDITIAESVTELGLGFTGPSSSTFSEPSLVTVGLSATQGSSPLNTLAVLENGVVMNDLSRLRYGDASIEFDTNPFVLPADDKAGFTKNILIAALATPGTNTYTIILEDESGATEQVTYDITIEETVTVTALTGEFVSRTLFNNAGSGFGTLNLETGENVSSINNTTSHIKDVGNLNGVWEQIVEPINGTVLRFLDTSSSAYSYAGIDSRESLLAAYDEAAGDLLASGTIVVGSTYLARVGAADYYVFICTSVNAAGGANDQFYTFDIKKSEF